RDWSSDVCSSDLSGWLSARNYIAWRQNRILCSIERKMIFQPKPVLMPTQTVVRRAVHTPLAQDVPCSGCPKLHPQHAALHAVIHLGDFGPGLVRVRNDLQLNNPGPLDVLITALM